MTDTNQLPEIDQAIFDDDRPIWTAIDKWRTAGIAQDGHALAGAVVELHQAIETEMRAYALQSRAQLAQGELLSDERMEEAAKTLWDDGWKSCRDSEYIGAQAQSEEWCQTAHAAVEKLRAILALRPAAQEVPMTPEQVGMASEYWGNLAQQKADADAKRGVSMPVGYYTSSIVGALLATQQATPEPVEKHSRCTTKCQEAITCPAGRCAMLPTATPEPVGEPVYQLQLSRGSWIDQEEHQYRYNQKHGNTVRIVYTRPTPAAQAVPMTDEQVRVLRFLLGESALEDCHFGGMHPDKRGRFWWRNNLRDAFGITAQAKDGGAA